MSGRVAGVGVGDGGTGLASDSDSGQALAWQELGSVSAWDLGEGKEALPLSSSH